ncbi:Outer dynein arm protein 1 [Cymbomonas tetramitiformis]|uniref:Outer dynein arm protein 1 n=1 Tax=Cymbomonas tetramitiformis TaxID=36881 RepID=A0AAE0G6Q9_9CHLO|nr:Outer dynein arm protein 1 [Cymbomonas tetramitiformis]|eukprot:gene16993-20202_t
MAELATMRSTAQSNIERINDQTDTYTKKVEIEKRRVADLDKQLEEARAKIYNQKKKLGGPTATRDTNDALKRQVKILENRLEKALQKYNATLAHNRKLRENIDNLRRERLVFDQIYKKLEKELVEKKKEMAHIVEVADRAYEARDAAVAEMARLKSQADQEQSAFEAEWRELGRLIDHDRKMRDFMKLKSKDKGSELEKSPEAMEEEAKLRKKAIKGSLTKGKDLTSTGSQVQSYGEAFAKIQSATGISDIDDLVVSFINAEDENYRLYKYVDELNQEIARLEESIQDIDREIKEYKKQGKATDGQRKGNENELDARLKATRQKAQMFQDKHEAALVILTTLKESLLNVYKKLGCDVPENRAVVGDEGVTEQNIMHYFAIIEQRGNEILQMYSAKIGIEDQQAITALVPQTPAAPYTFVIEPPSTTEKVASESDEGEEEEEEEDRPLTRSELEVKTLKTLSKRESGEKKKMKQKDAPKKEGV